MTKPIGGDHSVGGVGNYQPVQSGKTTRKETKSSKLAQTQMARHATDIGPRLETQRMKKGSPGQKGGTSAKVGHVVVNPSAGKMKVIGGLGEIYVEKDKFRKDDRYKNVDKYPKGIGTGTAKDRILARGRVPEGGRLTKKEFIAKVKASKVQPEQETGTKGKTSMVRSLASTLFSVVKVATLAFVAYKGLQMLPQLPTGQQVGGHTGGFQTPHNWSNLTPYGGEFGYAPTNLTRLPEGVDEGGRVAPNLAEHRFSGTRSDVDVRGRYGAVEEGRGEGGFRLEERSEHSNATRAEAHEPVQGRNETAKAEPKKTGKAKNKSHGKKEVKAKQGASRPMSKALVPSSRAPVARTSETQQGPTTRSG